MRTQVLVSNFAALAAAQSIDFSIVTAAPAVSVQSAPVTGTAQTVSAQSSAAATSIGSAAVQASPLAQRDVVADVVKRDGTCATQPAGTGPTVRPDFVDYFEDYPYFKAAAYSAPVPKGYSLNFTNLHASTSTSAYMGYTNLNKYDTNQCASLCNAQTGCVAFNLYFERDPTLDPNASSCPNPPSLTNIKCVFWGVPSSSPAQTATTSSPHRPPPPGWSGPTPWPGAPNCPSDPTSSDTTYIGSLFFSFGVAPGQVQYFSTGVCVAACSAQTSYNFAHPPAGKNPTVCNHVVAYQLNNAAGVAHGMYCAMYTESWDASYGTVKQSASVGGEWTVGAAYAYTNATYAASYQAITPGGYQGGNCGGWGAGTC
ncbi:hypothetical protein LSUE1_G005481 [Lachnellula suecica]|uniref:Apple domain-containing protein n=1 Tax=Lachnellula suecica TaxID=602035 RepID=A0A8T9C1Z2_9HELO|nr:hypothetical protein LSUE1_G005481 [Lachnellula suecica]